MAVVTAGAYHAFGKVTAIPLGDKAEKEAKIVATNLYDSYIDLVKNDKDGNLTIQTDKSEIDTFTKENMENILIKLPSDANLTIVHSGGNYAIDINASKKEINIDSSINLNEKNKESENFAGAILSSGAEVATINSQTYNIKELSNLELRNAIENIPQVSFLLSHILIKVGEYLDLGEKGIYKIKSGDTLSTIAKLNGMVTKDLLKLNTWLLDKNRVKFLQNKILVDTTLSESELNNKNHTLIGDSNAENILIDANGGDNEFIGGNKADKMESRGKGYDIYHANDGDEITDNDGKGKVIFNNTTLTGGTYDKEKDCYVNGDIEYHLNGKILTIKQGKESLTIKNFNKDNNDLGIVLLNEGEISISILDNEKQEGDTPKQSMNFNMKVNGEIPDGEFAIININGKNYLIGNPSEANIKKYNLDTSKYKKDLTYTYEWNGDKIKKEDRHFQISGSVVMTSEGLKVKGITSGNGTIIDDDRDDDPEDVDPIIIDLNKNGITSTKLNNTIYFDHDNNNFKEATSWIDKGDAFLALDKNSNGLIDNGNELFGNHTISNTKYGEKEANNKDTSINGYEALKAYDLNGDNVIDSKDEIYDKLLLWKDSNQNAITDKGELIKLKDSGIVSIDLNYKNTNTDEKGNTIKQSSTVTFEDGSTTIANDVWFK